MWCVMHAFVFIFCKNQVVEVVDIPPQALFSIPGPLTKSLVSLYSLRRGGVSNMPCPQHGFHHHQIIV